MISDKKIIKTFTTLAEIPSPSGKEKKMAEWIKAYFKKLEWKVWEDDTRLKNDSTSGNVYVYLEINPNFETLVFCAHMDTVQGANDKVSVIFDGKTFKSNGTTILGADNKSGVTSLILLAEILQQIKPKVNVLFFFPTREESGIMGSKFFQFPKKIKYIFNVDSSDTPGVFIYKSLGYINFTITVSGLAAHAAKEYENSINAILVASDLLLRLPIGKDIKKGWTCNIGTIHGGENTNIVCDEVTMHGELRAYDKQLIDRQEKQIKKIASKVAKKYKTTIDVVFDMQSYYSPFVGSQKSAITNICQTACKNVGIPYVTKQSFSTSDSNNLSQTGLPVISVSRGGSNAHSKDESLLFKDLKNTVRILEEIVRLCSL